MKIAFITHQFPGVRGGGIGTYVLQAARALAAAGHEAHIFTLTLPGDAAQLRQEQTTIGIHLHEVPELAVSIADGLLPAPIAAAVETGDEGIYRLAVGWILCEAVREFHRSHGLHVVEAPEYEALGLPLMLSPEGEGSSSLAVVTHLHLCSAIARAGNAAHKAPTPEDARIDALESAAILLADGLCAPTRYIVAETARLLGITPDAQIIPYPMQLSINPAPLPKNGPILFVGRLEPRKGAALMAPAFNQFLTRNPDAVIRLVGSDTQAPGATGKSESVRAAITASLLPEVRHRVVFTGEHSPAQVRAEFAACRFSVVPSLFDNFPYTAVESLAAGRPVVAGDSTGTVEVIGDAGLSFPRGNAEAFAGAIETLWRDGALCQRLAQQAASRATSLFSEESTIGARLAFYQRTMEHARSRRLPDAGGQRDLSAANPRHAAALIEWLALLKITAPMSSSTKTPGARLLAVMQTISPRSATVYLYGAGRHTARVMAQRRLWEPARHQVAGIIDDHPRFAAGARHLGLPVISIQEAAQKLTPGDHVVLSTDTFEDQFWSQTEALRAKGVTVHRLYDTI